MARLKFLCDVERCIDCSGCVVACKEGNHIPVGVNRRRVVTLNQGKPGEKSISVSCMHCADAPCIAVCPVDAIYQRDDGVVLVSKKTCIGCGYCMAACPYDSRYVHPKGFVDKCTFCLHRVRRGRQPACLESCPTAMPWICTLRTAFQRCKSPICSTTRT